MIKSRSRRYHPEFDLAAARKIYRPMERSNELRGEMVTSPFHLYSNEELRDRYKLRIGTPVPADVFVFCKGKPPKPDLTKLGGMPYWLDDRKWPADLRENPLRFLAQFNFVDSQDLYPDLPGDVLLIFGAAGDDWLDRGLHFEWLPAGGVDVSTSDPSRSLYPSTSLYGAIHRTADYPDSRVNARQMNLSGATELPFLNATKIGGRPRFIQSNDDLEAQPRRQVSNPFRPGEMMTIPASPSRKGYLCQLGSIQPEPNMRFPWANRATPLGGFRSQKNSASSEGNSVVFSDAGSFYVFRNEKGKLWSDFEFY